MANIEHLQMWNGAIMIGMKTQDLTPKQIFAVPCPTCGAATEEACELHSAARRTEPHGERKLSAAEAVEE